LSDQFVAEIRIFGGNFAPKGWAMCNGQLLAISQNTALFSLLGTYYGGDGKSNFALPNLQGTAPLQQGQSPGLSQYYLGQAGGEQAVTLITSEMPSHRHSAGATTTVGDQLSPSATVPAIPGQTRGAVAYAKGTADTTLAPKALGVSGGSLPHNNMPPFLVLNFIIALQGIYPPRP
jgi:microcystin-dependent protein